MDINLEIFDNNFTGRSVKNSEARFLLNVLSEMKQLPPMPYQGLGLDSIISQLREVGNSYGLSQPLSYSNNDAGRAIRTLINEAIAKGEFTMAELSDKIERSFPSLPPVVQESIQIRRPVR